MNSDEDNVSIQSETDDLPYTSPRGCGWSLDWGQTLHSGGANYSFADGHVKWLTPGQIQDVECGLGGTHFTVS
jgi:prepilin-type processing-associated H-X9-DG protein